MRPEYHLIGGVSELHTLQLAEKFPQAPTLFGTADVTLTTDDGLTPSLEQTAP